MRKFFYIFFTFSIITATLYCQTTKKPQLLWVNEDGFARILLPNGDSVSIRGIDPPEIKRQDVPPTGIILKNPIKPNSIGLGAFTAGNSYEGGVCWVVYGTVTGEDIVWRITEDNFIWHNQCLATLEGSLLAEYNDTVDSFPRKVRLIKTPMGWEIIL